MLSQTLLSRIGDITIGVFALFHTHLIGQNKFQADRAEVLEFLTFHNTLPTQEQITDIEKDALTKAGVNLDKLIINSKALGL